VRSDLQWLRDTETATTVSLIFYSGHGDQVADDNGDETDGHDEVLLCSNLSFIRDDELKTLLDSFEGAVVVIIEACYSGGMPALLVNKTGDYGLTTELSGTNRIIMTSSLEGQSSHGAAGYYSLFPLYVLAGWDGPADADQDNTITAEETFNYASAEVLNWINIHQPGWIQTPAIFDNYPGELPILVRSQGVNLPPAAPTNPNPPDGQYSVVADIELRCTVSDLDSSPLLVGFYWDEDTVSTFIGFDDSVASGGQAVMAVSGLSPFTHFRWHTTASDGFEIIESDVWEFDTGPQPNQPPTVASVPSPAMNAMNVDLDIPLQWHCSDPDSADMVTYQVYFGTDSTPSYAGSVGPFPASDSVHTFNIPHLDNNTSYYWRIVATDDHAHATTGPTWHFTTIPNRPPQVSNLSPHDSATNVSLNPELCVMVADPDSDAITVRFYGCGPSASFTTNSEAEWDVGTYGDSTTTDGSGTLQLAYDLSFYGNGTQDTIISTNTQLSTDRNYHNLTIQSGRTLDVAGHIIRVSGTLLNYGTITDNISGGVGGPGGASGRGQDPWQDSTPHGPTDPEPGQAGGSGQASSVPQAGHGGSGGGGGGGGGGAWWNLGVADADGGNGGSGGAGGRGGGYVRIYAYNLDNRSVIHADGQNGSNGSNGTNGEHTDWGIPAKDLAGGGGGGGGKGTGGNGGTVQVFYFNMVNAGTTRALAGSGGTNGTGGSGSCLHHGVASGDHAAGASGGQGGTGDGGTGEHRNGYCSTNGENGNNPAVPVNGHVYVNQYRYFSSGTYESATFDAHTLVNWTTAEITGFSPSGTTTVAKYGENVTGTWRWYDDIASVPDSRYFRFRITMTSTNHISTPTVDRIVISSVGRDSLLCILNNVTSGDTACHVWAGLASDSTYHWRAEAYDGHVTTGSPVWSFTTVVCDTVAVNDVTVHRQGSCINIVWSSPEGFSGTYSIYEGTPYGTWNPIPLATGIQPVAGPNAMLYIDPLIAGFGTKFYYVVSICP
jgi:hypothetical protein